MGYRSNVYIYILETEDTKRLIGSLEEIIERAEAIEKYSEVDEDGYIIGHNKDGLRVLQAKFSDIKWYESYPFVKYWEDIMDTLDEEGYPQLYLATLLGEAPRDFNWRGELGEAYEYTDYDLSIDFSTVEDDEFEKNMEAKKFIKEKSGIGNIITGDSWYKEDEPRQLKKDNIDTYLTSSK